MPPPVVAGWQSGFVFFKNLTLNKLPPMVVDQCMYSYMSSLLQGGCDRHSRDNAQISQLHLTTGCGFLDAVVKLVELGADPNCRGMSHCIPLQNIAHWTYSALTAVPPGMADGTTAKLAQLFSQTQHSWSIAGFGVWSVSSCFRPIG